MSNKRNDGLGTYWATGCIACVCWISVTAGCQSLGKRPAADVPQASLANHEDHREPTEDSQASLPHVVTAAEISNPQLAQAVGSSPVSSAAGAGAVIPVAYSEPIENSLAASSSPAIEVQRGAVVQQVAFRRLQCSHGKQHLEACAPQCGECFACEICSPQPRCRNAQEYIFDGGDQQPRVVVREDWSAEGINPTDTVVYYETDSGTLCVQPSNRVPIYAPRFGAVRQVTGAFLAAKAIGTQRILAPVKPGRLDEVDLPGAVVQPVAPFGEEQVNLIDAFQENVAGTPIASVIPPERMSEALVPFEGIDVLRTGRITDEEILVMGRILQNARTWILPESLGVIVDGQQAHIMIDTIKPQDVHVFEIPDKCTLRICKTASHTIANSGDIVNFTIRFDNAGSKPVHNIVIVDSLSPRLEYIQGSQQSSIDARFATEPNDVGSEVLRWEIDTIDKLDGGVISFDCRVR